jgi:hypothetical protein
MVSTPKLLNHHLMDLAYAAKLVARTYHLFCISGGNQATKNLPFSVGVKLLLYLGIVFHEKFPRLSTFIPYNFVVCLVAHLFFSKSEGVEVIHL